VRIEGGERIRDVAIESTSIGSGSQDHVLTVKVIIRAISLPTLCAWSKTPKTRQARSRRMASIRSSQQ